MMLRSAWGADRLSAAWGSAGAISGPRMRQMDSPSIARATGPGAEARGLSAAWGSAGAISGPPQMKKSGLEQPPKRY